jgi:outer membrane protein assembly factor BamB
VVIRGTGFGTGGTTLTIAGHDVHVARWSPTVLEIFVPEETPLGNHTLMMGTTDFTELLVRPRSPLSGRFTWRLKVPDQYITTRPAVGPDGTVYAVGNYGHLYAVTPDGALKWVRPASGNGTVDVDNLGRIYCAGGGGVQAYSPEGERVWTFSLNTPLMAGPNVGPDGKIYAVDNIRWAQGIFGAMVFDRAGNLLWNGGEFYNRGANDMPHEVVFDHENAYFFSDQGASGGMAGIHALHLGGGLNWVNPDGVGRQPTGIPGGGVGHIGTSTVENWSPDGERRFGRSLWDFGGYQTKGDVVALPDGSIFTLLSNSKLLGFFPDGTTRFHNWLIDTPSWLTPRPDGAAFLVETMVNFGQPKRIRSFTPSGNQLWFTEELPIENGMVIGVFNRIRITQDSMTAYFGTSGPMTAQDTAYSYLYAMDAAGRSFAEAFEILRGSLISGGLSDLQNSDDQRLILGAGATFSASEPPIQVVTTSTSPVATPQTLRVRIEARASSANLRQSVDLWDYVSGQYVIIDFRPSTLEDSVMEADAPNPTRFVQAGTRQIRARFTWKATGSVFGFPWRAQIDRAMFALK